MENKHRTKSLEWMNITDHKWVLKKYRLLNSAGVQVTSGDGAGHPAGFSSESV